MIAIAVGIFLYLAGFRLPTEAQLDALDAHIVSVDGDTQDTPRTAFYPPA